MPRTPPPLLDDDALRSALLALPGWQLAQSRDALVRHLSFASFAAAFAFMTEMAMVSERADHHPEWRNVHRHVDIRLNTHESGGVTARDIAWARHADDAYARHGGVA